MYGSQTGYRLAKLNLRVQLNLIVIPRSYFSVKQQKIKREFGYWDKDENVKEFLKEIQTKLNLNSAEDWDKLKQREIRELGGDYLVTKYPLYKLKLKGCPELSESKFKIRAKNNKKPNGYWDSEENIKIFIKDLIKKCNITNYLDINKLSTKDLIKFGGNRLLSKFSLKNIKERIYSDNILADDFWKQSENVEYLLHKIKQENDLNSVKKWRELSEESLKELVQNRIIFELYSLNELESIAFPNDKNNKQSLKKPNGFWKNEENILEFISTLKEFYNIETNDQWNKITRKQIKNLGGGRLLELYSLEQIKKLEFDYNQKDNYKNVNKREFGFWKNEENILTFISKLKNMYKLEKPEDLFALDCKKINALDGGNNLLKNLSLFELKVKIFPEFKNLSFFQYRKKNQKIPANYWKNHDNIQQFIHELALKYNLKSSNDWNELSSKQIKDFGGKSIFKHFSLFELKCLACPELDKFSHLPKNQPKPDGFWDKFDNIQGFLNSLRIRYKINSENDWYRISREQIIQSGGGSLLCKYSLYELLSFVKPDILNQNENYLNSFKRSSQRELFLKLHDVYPNYELIEDFYHAELSRISGFSIQFDIFIPEKNLAFEYHGIQHYEDTSSIGLGSLEMYQTRDFEKLQLCLKNNIQLVIIPYSWDKSLASLLQIINSHL